MARPSKKAKEIEDSLEELAGRTSSIKEDKCVKKPIGCGGPASEFKDDVSRREYTISGLCQKCQDDLFG